MHFISCLALISCPCRLSLQTADKNRHIYENRDQVSEPHNSPRRASFDDVAFDSSRMESHSSAKRLESHSDARRVEGHGDTRQLKLPSGEDDKLYQNVTASSNSHPSRASPTKKTHLSALSVPVPEGYYTVTPPPLVRRHHSGNVSPSTSPEEDGEMSLVKLKQTSGTDHDQEISMDIVGDNLIVNKSSRHRSKALSPPCEDGEAGGIYQNVELTNGSGGDSAFRR